MAGANSHLFLGSFPLVAGVNAVALANLLICLLIICTVSSTEPLRLAGVEFSPSMQLLTATWASIGVFAAIYGGVGAVYRIESQIRTYRSYMIGTLVVEAIWAYKIVTNGSICAKSRSVSAGDSVNNALSCGITNSFGIFWVLVFAGLSLYALFILHAATKQAQNRAATELLRYEEPWAKAAATGATFQHELERASPSGRAPNLDVAARAPGRVHQIHRVAAERAPAILPSQAFPTMAPAAALPSQAFPTMAPAAALPSKAFPTMAPAAALPSPPRQSTGIPSQASLARW